MKILLNFVIVFVILSVVSSVLIDGLDADFGRINFWQEHGLFLVLGLALFPRLTLLFSSIPTGGLTWWLGFIICPRFLIAVLATGAYWQTNPILVCFSWLFVLGGETSEKIVIHRRVFRKANTYNPNVNSSGDVIDV